ncbi:MASE1 domain-containing protein [Streptomyces coerulescens]|uniref:MASE1 domain-containing protein n=1 Tax=Streptomyces coerulescens TaxID=29304 RepID=A0ABW0CFF1_STRCD
MTSQKTDSPRLRDYAAHALRLTLVTAAYYGSAKLGLEQQLVRGQVTPFWPPTGIALVALLMWGLRMWPGIALGAFVVNVTLGPSILPVLAIVAGNTIAPVCAFLMLRRVRFRPALDRLQDALALIFLGALGGMLISATIGTGVLVASEALTADDFWPTWSVWWTGDAMGVLVIAPLLLAARALRRPHDIPVLRWVEAAALLVGTTVASVVATRSSLNLLFLAVPFLLWAAFRFQLPGAAPCALITSVVAITAGAEGVGPFSGQDLLAKMVILQAFNGTVALTSLLLSATIAERNHTVRALREACERLTEALSRLVPDQPLNHHPALRMEDDKDGK